MAASNLQDAVPLQPAAGQVVAESEPEAALAATSLHCSECKKSLLPQELASTAKKLCKDCNSLLQVLFRNLGAGALDNLTSEDRAQFFGKCIASKQGSRYEWSVVRAALLECRIERRTQQKIAEIGGPFLPMSVWLNKGYSEDHVRKFPCEKDIVGEETWQVQTKSVSRRDVQESVEEELLQRESDLKQLRQSKGKGKSPQDSTAAAEPELHVPKQPALPLQQKEKTDKQKAQAAAREEKARAQAAAQTARKNRALCTEATAALSKLQPKEAALEKLQQKAKQHKLEDLGTRVQEAREQLQEWLKAGKQCVAASDATGAVLGELPFTQEMVKGFLQAVQQLQKDVNDATPKPQPKPKKTAATAAAKVLRNEDIRESIRKAMLKSERALGPVVVSSSSDEETKSEAGIRDMASSSADGLPGTGRDLMTTNEIVEHADLLAADMWPLLGCKELSDITLASLLEHRYILQDIKETLLWQQRGLPHTCLRTEAGVQAALKDAEHLLRCARREAEERVLQQWNTFCPEKAVKEKTFQDTVNRDRLPSSCCFEELELPAVPAAGTDSTPVFVLAAHIPRLLQFLTTTSPPFAQALFTGLEHDPQLQMILYHDEAQGGNILAVHKWKKATLFYASFSQLRTSAHLQQCWLPVGMVQHEEAERAAGGLSAVLARILRFIWQSADGGFSLVFNGVTKATALTRHCHLLCDYDAQRACLGITGSNGMRCCVHCTNVLRKNSQVERAPFVEYSEHSRLKFVKALDEDHWAAADKLRTLQKGEEIKNFVKTSGIKCLPEALLHDKVAREILPVSCCAADSMHLYYHQGLISWEVANVWAAFRQQAPGLTLQMLKDTVTATKWYGPGNSNHARPAYIGSLFHEKLWADGQYKGQAEDASALVPLLRYYLEVLCRPRGLLEKELASFNGLADLHSEIRRLQFAFRPLGEDDVQDLRKFEEKQQQLYVDAYGADETRPKHHHRFHLSEGCVLLKMMPSCMTHEAKHQIYKQNLCDRYQSKVKVPRVFLRKCLTIMLETTVHQQKKLGMARWQLNEPCNAAAGNLRRALSSSGLLEAKSMTMWQSTVSVGDVLIFSKQDAGVVLQCLGDDQALWLLLQSLQHLSDHAWGCRWQLTQKQKLWKVRADEPY
ncbi:unnamed protein product [Symbiodinium sp. KB8]|nr:unnamed protein product [Symbiodinium sp. KB8]